MKQFRLQQVDIYQQRCPVRERSWPIVHEIERLDFVTRGGQIITHMSAMHMIIILLPKEYRTSTTLRW
jgi:hypothetical protein